MNLNQIKQEAREEVKKRKYTGWTNFGKRDLTTAEEWFNSALDLALEDFDAFADRFVDEIEKAVGLENMRLTEGNYPDGSYKRGYVKARDEVQEAFTRFKGESHD